MRKYDVLNIIAKNNGISPKELSEKIKTSLPNIYSYLKELTDQELIKKIDNKYIGNYKNKKFKIMLNIQSACSEHFSDLITHKFGQILQKLCHELQTTNQLFNDTEIKEIENIAVPKRIVLVLAKNPKIYCLKINETLVVWLLEYHKLKAKFTLSDFHEVIKDSEINLSKPKINYKELSDQRIIEICDQYYMDNKDMEIILKSNDFSLDDKFKTLLQSIYLINNEYKLYLNGLSNEERSLVKDQWVTKYVYNTNKIEGNTMTQQDVELALNKKDIEGDYSKKEVYETNNTKGAVKFLELKEKEQISEELIKELHFLIQMNIDPNNGYYKRIYNYVGHHSPTTPPKNVKQRMKLLIEWYHQNKNKYHPIVLGSLFHMQYELIHPFEDGNGRVGRLLFNKILEMNGYLPIIISDKNKQNYYHALESVSIPMFLDCIIAEFIENYRR